MLDLKMKVVLLAPTGRAAKVFSVNSGQAAYTIHRRIYREKAYTGIGGYSILPRTGTSIPFLW
jgi:ATP-dependent exoDNAse (exonuclease V) alpha subunit